MLMNERYLQKTVSCHIYDVVQRKIDFERREKCEISLFTCSDSHIVGMSMLENTPIVIF
jgi:hypothetical protein